MLRSLLALFALTGNLVAQQILVAPYVQPGNGSQLSGADVKVIAWLTDRVPAEYTVEYRIPGHAMKQAAARSVALDFAAPSPLFGGASSGNGVTGVSPLGRAPTDIESLREQIVHDSAVFVPDAEQHYLAWTADLHELPFDSTVTYHVRLGQKVIREASFKTRASSGNTIRFAAVGDLADGGTEQNAIAWQIAAQRPDFMIGLGDLAYSQGRVGQYIHHFWPTYDGVAASGPDSGAPLFAATPLYPVLGNHDVEYARLASYPDAFGAYYFFHVPQNGPGTGPWSLPLGNDRAAADSFRARVGTAYPALNMYSWDDGPAHFLVLDSNNNTKAEEPRLRAWIDADLHNSRQPWKFVCFHVPCFHTSLEHYSEQKMRLLEPIFEKNGVDVVFAGHVHNYQRSRPLHFTPAGIRDLRGNVKGAFKIDSAFDGVTATKPDGIIHIVSGGGGATLYSLDYENTVETLKLESGGSYVPFTAKYVATTHSFSLIDLTPTRFTLRQLSSTGEELDRISITK